MINIVIKKTSDPDQTWDPAFSVAMILASLSIFTRLFLHFSWLTIVRYKLAMLRPFTLKKLLVHITWTFAISYFVAIALTGGALVFALSWGFLPLLLPSFLAATLAPVILYKMTGQLFDTVVRDRLDAHIGSRTPVSDDKGG